MKRIIPVAGIVMLLVYGGIFCGGEDLEKENWCEAACERVIEKLSNEELCQIIPDPQCDPNNLDHEPIFEECYYDCEGEQNPYDNDPDPNAVYEPWPDGLKDCVYKINGMTDLMNCMSEYNIN